MWRWLGQECEWKGNRGYPFVLERSDAHLLIFKYPLGCKCGIEDAGESGIWSTMNHRFNDFVRG